MKIGGGISEIWTILRVKYSSGAYSVTTVLKFSHSCQRSDSTETAENRACSSRKFATNDSIDSTAIRPGADSSAFCLAPSRTESGTNKYTRRPSRKLHLH